MTTCQNTLSLIGLFVCFHRDPHLSLGHCASNEMPTYNRYRHKMLSLVSEADRKQVTQSRPLCNTLDFSPQTKALQALVERYLTVKVSAKGIDGSDINFKVCPRSTAGRALQRRVIVLAC